MSDFEGYEKEFEKSQSFYVAKIGDRESKAFEYGTLVVRNAIIVSGGALLAIPTIASLASEVRINIVSARVAGFAFAASLVLAILGAYVIHLNWLLHVAAWEVYWQRQQKTLFDFYIDGKRSDPEKRQGGTKYDTWIGITFWIPHFLAILYLFFMGYGFFRLYGAFGLA